jgi:DNA-binding GntR family transcriptional regulator
LKLLDIFCTIYKNLRDTSLLFARDLVAVVDNHEEILEAIVARDAPLARRRVREHFCGIREKWPTALARQKSPQ